MPLVKAQCTNCGATLDVDSAKEAAICPFCNTPYIVEKAIVNANNSPINIDNATVNISSENIDNLLLRALEFENQNNCAKAIEYYNRILDIDFNNNPARKGLERLQKELDCRYIGHTRITLEQKEELITLKSQNKIEAIKKVRLISGCSLVEANEFVENDFYNWEECDLNTHNTTSNSSSGGCYVATSVYGSYNCPQVWTLRRYRDDTLAKTWYGRLFIRVYYAVSPTLVKWFGHTNWFKKIFRNNLDKMVKNLNANGVKNTPYKDKNWN